jgi:DNA-binding CsgD family transcriptional regulator/PAS domain-containing protein
MTSESEALSNVIADLYDAAVDPSLWQRALGNACIFVGGASAALVWHDAAANKAQAMHMYNDDVHYTRLYFEKYLPMNPLFPAATFMEPGEVHTSNDIVPQEELVKTRFYREWIEPQGIVDAIGVNLEKGVMRASMLNFRMDASYGIVDEAALQRTRLIVPHFQRAVAIGRLFDQSKTVEAVLTETLDGLEAGVFLLDAQKRIVFANALAQNILAEGKILRENGQALAAVLPEADRLFQEVLAAAERGDDGVGAKGVAVPLSGSSNDRWFAHVLPLTSGQRRQAGATYCATAAVYVRKSPLEGPTPLEAIAKLYKLTASEVRILHAVLKLGSVKAMAETLGISQATVKTHLHNLFRKTDTNRRSDLVKLVAGL